MALLEIKDLSFTYPEATANALENISFSVNEGEFCILCGESGCGKTTLLKLLKKQISPYGDINGEIIYNGKNADLLSDRLSASEIGFIMQNPENQVVTDTVWHELCFGLENLGVPTDVIRRRVAETVNFFGINDWFYKKTSELSGGQKQLLNLASVLVMQPKLLLLDEPTAQLDPVAASDFLNILQNLNKELGLTVIIAEHNLEEILSISDKVLMLNGGRLEFSGDPRAFAEYFRNNPSHTFARAQPAAARIYGMLQSGDVCPLNVKEGRRFLSENFRNDVDVLPQRSYDHSPEKTVELKNVWFRYEKNLPDILKDASFSVFKGEHFCILGGNGTGKTTTIGIIAGLLKPYCGKVLINGKPAEKYRGNSLYHKNIAVLPQNPELLFLHKTVAEDLSKSAAAFGLSAADTNKKISEISELLHIENILGCHPYDLSGGEQQKAALAKVLISEPRILLLDEPTKALDVGGKKVIADIIKTMTDNGITVITVTHDVDFAAENADRCGLFFDGAIVSENTPTEFFDQNSFYTTAANRIARGYFKKAILCEEVAALCKLNGGGEQSS